MTASNVVVVKVNVINGIKLTTAGLNGDSNCRLKTRIQLTFRKKGWL